MPASIDRAGLDHLCMAAMALSRSEAVDMAAEIDSLPDPTEILAATAMTNQRKYSVDEIDAMRDSIQRIYGMYSSNEAKNIEERLRTFMMNGTDPSELIARADAARCRQREADKTEMRRRSVDYDRYATASIESRPRGY